MSPSFLLFAAAVVAFGVIVVHLQARTAQHNLEKLAEILGLEVEQEPPILGLVAKLGSAAGMHRGYHLRLHSFVAGAGKNKVRWIAASLSCDNPAGLDTQISARGIIHRLGSLIGQEPLDTGDAVFDEQIAINTSAPEFLRTVLSPETRSKLLRAWETASEGTRIDLEGDLIALKVPGSFASKRACRSLETMIPVLLMLAELPETYAAKN